MRVLTWNLWWRFGPWEQRRDAIREVLRATDADLVGLQEVWAAGGRNLAAELAEELSMYWAWSPSPAREYWRQRSSDGEVEIGNAVLSRWPIDQTRCQALPADALGDGRTILFSAIRAPVGSVPFFTTQLSSPPAVSELRCAQVREVSRFVARHAGPGFPPVLTAI